MGGWDDISVDHVKTPLRALVDSKKLSANAFAFYLGSGGANGELVLGGVDPAHYTGDFSYVPVIETAPGKYGYWALTMDDAKVVANPSPQSARQLSTLELPCSQCQLPTSRRSRRQLVLSRCCQSLLLTRSTPLIASPLGQIWSL